MKKVLIVSLSVLGACFYGVVHDEITARVCLEYFTVAHPPLFPTSSTTLLAFYWGIAATAGIGAALGAVLAIVSQEGKPPPWPVSRVLRSILMLLAAMGVVALGAGLTGYRLASGGLISLPGSLAAALPAPLHDRFMAVWWAHCASYLTGIAGAAYVCFRIWSDRGRPEVISILPRNRGGWLRAAALAAIVGGVVWFRFIAH